MLRPPTTPDWQAALDDVRRRHDELVIGLGTVTTVDDAAAALDLGADFVVSPFPVPAVRHALPDALLIEGGMTVGEVVAAARQGIAKLFPAHVGGTEFVKSVLSVEPGAAIVPTGGIRLGDVGAWLSAGALAVGVGSDLLAQPDLANALTALTDR